MGYHEYDMHVKTTETTLTELWRVLIDLMVLPVGQCWAHVRELGGG